MFVRQVLHEDLGCASYLVGDEDAGRAAVVDPQLEIEPYLELVDRLGVRIELVFETHTHADHVSGHGRLAVATGAPVHVHRDAEAGYEHRAFGGGATWSLGALELTAIHTPGHRPEHCSFLLTDTARGGPFAVLSGDSLLVGDLARPDLAIEPAAAARQLLRSVRDRLLTLPDTVELWPGHVGGSMCAGSALGMRLCSTIGFERLHGAAAALADEDAFVERTLLGLGERPPNTSAIVAANRGPMRTGRGEPPPFSPAGVGAIGDGQALVVDVRDPRSYARGHLSGAVNLDAGPRGFGINLAWLAAVFPDREIVLVGDSDADAIRAGRLAAAVAVDGVRARLAGGMAAWEAAGLPRQTLEQVSVAELAALTASQPELQILDVREREAWEADRVPGSLNASWRHLAALPAELDPERPVATICVSGRRAATAAGLLRRAGARRVIQVADGGVPDW